MSTAREIANKHLAGLVAELSPDELITLAETYLRDIRYEWYETSPDTIAAAIDDLCTIAAALKNRIPE